MIADGRCHRQIEDCGSDLPGLVDLLSIHPGRLSVRFLPRHVELLLVLVGREKTKQNISRIAARLGLGPGRSGGYIPLVSLSQTF